MNPNHTSLQPGSATPFLTLEDQVVIVQDTCTLRASLGPARPLVEVGSVISAYKIPLWVGHHHRSGPQFQTSRDTDAVWFSSPRSPSIPHYGSQIDQNRDNLGLGGIFLPHCPLKLPVTVVTLNPLMKALEVSHASIAVSSTRQSHMLAQELEMLQVLASASSQSLKAYGSQQMNPSP